MAESLQTRSQQVRILDGGMGKELHRIGAPFQQPEWSAQALLDDPEFVRQAHQNFVDAGAEIIITNAYAVVPYHLGAERFDERGAELAELAATIARQVATAANAANAAGRKVLVAGSLPPLFGSYAPDDFRTEDAPAIFDVLVTAQQDHVDLWIGETISSIAELRAVIASVADRPEPIWVSFTLDDDVEPGQCQLRSGESVTAGVEAALAATAATNRLAAVLFNCSQPERMDLAITEAAAALGNTTDTAADTTTEIAIGVYANAFVEKEEGYSSNGVILGHRTDLTPELYASMAADWVERGASIIGGCCGIGPDHIAALARN